MTRHRPSPLLPTLSLAILARRLVLVLLLSAASCVQAEQSKLVKINYGMGNSDQGGSGQAQSQYRGWDYLVAKLRADGVPEEMLKAIYQNPRMPYFTPITFKLNPVEQASI